MQDFSLIILCAARRHLLSLTLDTLKSQKGSFEVLVIDNDPVDRVGELAANYPEFKLRVERMEGGLAEMMNRGVHEAEGIYIQFLEPGDRYISQHGLAFLSELIEKKPHLILGRGNLHDARFFWFRREKVLQWGGFNEKFRFCPMRDLLCRFELQGAQLLVCPRVVVDSPYEPIESVRETCQILYRHFGVKRALQWVFVQNRPRFIQRAARFIKQSFWRDA